jgi:glyoxylase-like metal-dependent hydrolase (beta-lactamase superfamily II)
MSHSHFDHVGGVELFPSGRFLIGAPDLSYAHDAEIIIIRHDLGGRTRPREITKVSG